MKATTKAFFYIILLGWLPFIFLCLWGEQQGLFIRGVIACIGLIACITGSLFFVMYERVEASERNAAEKQELERSIELYNKAKRCLENYVYDQCKANDHGK